MVAILAFALALGGFLLAAPPLYPAYAHQSVRRFGIGPALDQYLAGLVMIGEQVGSLTLCFAFLLPAASRTRADRRSRVRLQTSRRSSEVKAHRHLQQ